MTTETTTSASPERALAAAREFFLSGDGTGSAWLEDESETHLALGTFRGNMAVSAFRDPEDGSRTRVRVTSLREEGIVPRLITYLSGLAPESVGSGEA